MHVCVKQKMSRLRGVLGSICVCVLRYNPQKMSLKIPASQWDLMLEKVCNDHTVQLSSVFFFYNENGPQLLISIGLMSRSHFTLHGCSPAFSDSNMPPECFGSSPVPRWWTCCFTGVTVWLCRRSNKHWGSRFWPGRGSPRQVSFIVNYGQFWGSQSQVHSYIKSVLFMGNYKTPKNFFSFFYLPHEASFEVSVRCCHFLKPVFLQIFGALSHLWPQLLSPPLFFFLNLRHLILLKAIWLICCHL